MRVCCQKSTCPGRCARPRAELPGVDARRARGCRHAASRSRRACTLPCPLLCPAPLPCADSGVLCEFVTGQKKTQRFKFVSIYFCFFGPPRVNKKYYHSNSTFGNVAASQKMSEVLRSASPPRTATSSACSFRKFYPISKQMKTRKVIAVSRRHICMYMYMHIYVFERERGRESEPDREGEREESV